MVSFTIFLSSSLEYVVTDCVLVGMRSGAFSSLQALMTRRMHVGTARIVSIGSRRWNVYQTIVGVGPIAKTNGGYIFCASCPRASVVMMLISISFTTIQVSAKGLRQHRDRIDGKERLWVTGCL